MGVIQQLGRFSGNPYSFQINGETPTVEEAGRISQILSQQELPYQQQYEAQYGGIGSFAAAKDTGPDTSFGSAFKSSIDQPLENIAETARTLGFEGTGDFFSNLTDAPENYESATEQFLNEDGTGFDITAAPRAIVEQTGQFAGSMISRGTGAVLGGLVGGAPGAVIGGFAGPALFESIQLLGPIANARATNNGRDVPNRDDWIGAVTSAGASGALNAIAPGVSGFLKKVLVEAGTEGLQSLVQQAGETAVTDKGLEIKPKQAVGEALLGGGAAGVIAGPIELIKGKKPEIESEAEGELKADLIEQDSEGRGRLGYADQVSRELTEEVERQNDEAINVENPQINQEFPDGLPVSEVTTDEEFAANTFNKAQYDRVMQQIKSDIAREKSLSVTGIQQQVKKDLPDTKVSQVKDIMAELESRGYLSSQQSTPFTNRNTGVRYKPSVKYQATENMAPQLKTPDVSYRRQIDIANEAVEKNKKIIADLELDLDSVREYGRDLQGKRTSESAIQYEMDRLNKRNTQYGQTVQGAQQGLQRLGRLPYVPKVTPSTGAALNLETKVAAAKARSVADQVKEKVQSNKPVFTPALNEKQDNVFKSIRKRLDGYGLKDVRLDADQVVDEENEGRYNPVGRIISLAMGVYDPNLSETELFNRVGEVLDHETTHALKEMNVITPAEWSALTNAAGKVKYAKTKDGQAQKRKYSYLDRAKRMYSDNDAEVQVEEAVAEMFRDYNAGRLKLAGKPKGLFNKIKNFFRSIVGGSVDNGFTDVQSIFDNINVGEVGGRQRGAAIRQATQPVGVSSFSEQRIPSDFRLPELEEPANFMPGEEQDVDVKFSRLPRTPNVSGLQNFIRNNPDGFTIDPVTMEPVSSGFVVAPLKEAEIIVGDTLPEEVMLGYIEDNKDIARAVNKPVYLGGWFDEDSQQYFLDNTLIVPTAEEALYIAEAADQLAIFNLNNFEEIRTNEGIRQLQSSGAYRGDTAVGYQRNLAEVGRRFAEARNNRNASQREQLTRGVEGFRQSRLTLPLSPDQRAASVLDYLDPDTGQPKFKNRPGSETLVSFANKLLELRGTRSYDLMLPDDREDVARIMAAEAEAALLSSSDALGWYDSTLKLAKQILFPLYPEVSPLRPDGTDNALYDPASEHAFDFATAITSNGLSVIDNYLLASRQYDAWKNSSDGRFPLSASGKQGQSMIKAWEFWNHLTDFGYDSNQINELLMTQLPKGELAGLMTEVFGVERVKDLPFQIDGGELASENVGVAYVLGPKIGNGFYQNLRGNFSPLTMDRWWMRFVNRITGNPIIDYKDELVQENKEKLWSMISNPDNLSDMDKRLLVDTLESLGISTVEKSDIELIAPQVQKVWDKNFYKKAFNDKLDSLNDQYDFIITKTGTVAGKDADKVKKLAQDARPKSTDLALAAKNLAVKLKPELQEDPRNARERANMRATAVRAREILRSSNQLGIDISNADFQALMWYAEKRIFEAGGVRKGRGDDNDYADGAIAILENKGVSDDKIKATLPTSERGRLSSVKSQLKRDAEIGREIDQIQRGPIEGNFFAPRELTFLDSSMAAQEQLTVQELAETDASLSDLEVDPDLPPQRFSRMVTAEALVPVRAPVNLKSGSPNPVYGYFMDRGKLRPIVLPKGSHRTYESGVEVGQGLFHIQERNHDKELVENSKYKRVENAIYDLLRRWQDQGYDDGAAVISYPSQDGVVLEWRNNIAFSAPPMRLVLQSGRDLPNAVAKDVFYVKTFFPILEKKARKTSPQARQSRMYSVLAQDVEEKNYNISYAKTADILAKGLGFVMSEDKAQVAADTVIRKFQDDMLPVGRMMQELKKAGAKITDAFDAYLQEELYHGRVGAEVESRQKTIYKDAVTAVKNLNISEPKIAELKTLSKFFEQASENYPSKKLAIADAVLYATHAMERNAFILRGDPSNISGSGMTDGEAAAILAWVATLDASSIAELQNVQASVRAIVRDTNDSRANYGLTPEELRTDSNFNSYVPLRGKNDPVDAESETSTRLSGKGFGVRGREDQRALGRSDYATDILATSFNQNQNTVVRGERNRVGQAFIKMLQAEPDKTRGYGRILDRLPTMRTRDESGKVVVVRDPTAAQNENIFVAKVDGKDVYVELSDVRIANALKGGDGTGASSVGGLTRAMGKLNRYLSSINTSYNPEFIITNVIRDIQTAGVNVQQFDAEGMITSMRKDYVKAWLGIQNAIRKGDKDSEWAKIYADFVRDGGQNSANPMNSVSDQIANIENVLGDIAEDGVQGKFNKMKNSFAGDKVGSIFRLLEDYNTVAENAIRVTVYKGLKEKGFTNERAAQAARNVTVNFGKGGENKAFMNSWYLFYNASLQGSFALFNGLVRSPKVRRIWGYLIAYGLMQDFINSLLSEEDEDEILVYDKIPDHILEHNLVLATGGLTDRGYITIPMPYGLNSAVNAGRALGRTLRGEYSASEGATSMLMTTLDSLNPLGGTENFLNFAMPTVVDPFIEVVRNENFAGIPIYKAQYPGDQSPDSQRYFNSVSPSSKWIAQNVNSLTGGTSQMSGFLDWNPEIMDYWFDYLTGGIGRFVQRTSVDVPLKAYNEGLTEDLVSEIPFIRKLIGSVSEREDVGIFVEKRDRVLRVGQEIKSAQDAGDRNRIIRARDKYAEEFALLPRVKAINNAIRKVSKQQNAVRDNVNLPDSQRKVILERLDKQKQMLYARGNMILKDYR